MDNSIQNTDVLLPGGLGSVTVATTGASAEITGRFDGKDGSTTLTLTPIKKSIQEEADFIVKCDKEGVTPVICKARSSGRIAAMRLARNTEDAEFEIIQNKIDG